jgi:carbon-monoxide dehydrogenase small subunit
MSFPITLQVNASTVQRDMAPSRLLIDFLRDDLGLTGTHQGCDTSQCGACTVLVDGKAVKSCNVLVVQVNGSHIRTVEGLATSQGLHPMQEAFGKHHGLQCGYCTPGMVMRALAMVNEDVPAEEESVRHALGGNICRCTGYQGIVSAVCEGLQTLRANPSQSVPA